MSRALVIAPFHADVDVRVRRTVEVLADLVGTVDVFWDRGFSGHRYSSAVDQARVIEHYVTPRPRRLVQALFSQSALPSEIHHAMAGATIVYIHSSGIEGLVTAREVRRISATPLVVLDYHDSILFELYYQLNKRGAAWLYFPIRRLYSSAISFLSRSIDALVGISCTQLEQFFAISRYRCPALVVPNVRRFSPIRMDTAAVDGGNLRVVWLGHVMAGRDLEQVAAWIASSAGDTELHVFGEVIDEAVVRHVRRLLGSKVAFHGPYLGDEDLSSRLPGRAIGVFLGWHDPLGTGINSIASPNKYYSYVNLGLPVIVHASLTGLSAELSRWRAGLIAGDESEFAKCTDIISHRYEDFAEGMRALKESYLRYDPRLELASFLRRSVEGKLVAGHLGR